MTTQYNAHKKTFNFKLDSYKFCLPKCLSKKEAIFLRKMILHIIFFIKLYIFCIISSYMYNKVLNFNFKTLDVLCVSRAL